MNGVASGHRIRPRTTDRAVVLPGHDVDSPYLNMTYKNRSCCALQTTGKRRPVVVPALRAAAACQTRRAGRVSRRRPLHAPMPPEDRTDRRAARPGTDPQGRELRRRRRQARADRIAPRDARRDRRPPGDMHRLPEQTLPTRSHESRHGHLHAPKLRLPDHAPIALEIQTELG